MVDSLLASSTYRLRKKLYSAHAQHTRRKRSVGVTSVFWSAGQTLRISFLNGTCPWHKQAIVATACHWLRYANLHFKLVNDGDSQAEIRIRTDVAEDINYSVLGNQSLNEADESMAIAPSCQTRASKQSSCMSSAMRWAWITSISIPTPTFPGTSRHCVRC